MYIYATPNEEVESYIEGAPAGLVGTVGYQIINLETDLAVAARTTSGITEIPSGSGAYYARVTAPNKVGSYGVVWDIGTITPETSASDVLVVNSTGVVPPTVSGTSNLISLDQLKIAHEISLTEEDEERDARFEQAIRAASAAVRSFTDRSFGVPTKTSTKTYETDSSGFIDIDDAQEIKKVSFIYGLITTTVNAEYWRAEPLDGPPFEYLLIPQYSNVYSTAMGFTYNLDVFTRDHAYGPPPLVSVEAVWGWPTVPPEVEQATILTASDMANKPDSFTGESIENYSYTTGARAGSMIRAEAIPARAQDLLAPYVRFQI